MKAFSSSAALRFAAPLLALCLSSGIAAAQNHITRAIDNRQRLTLRGNLHPKALAEDVKQILGQVSKSWWPPAETGMPLKILSPMRDASAMWHP